MRPETESRLAYLSQLLEDSDGEVDAEIEQLMGEIEHDVEGLADWWGRTIRRMTAQHKAAKDEADYWRDKAKRFDARLTKLKGRVLEDLKTLGVKKVQTDLFTISRTKSRPKTVVLCSPEELPEWAQRVKVEANTSAIAQRLETEDLDFARSVPGEHVRVR